MYRLNCFYPLKYLLFYAVDESVFNLPQVVFVLEAKATRRHNCVAGGLFLLCIKNSVKTTTVLTLILIPS